MELDARVVLSGKRRVQSEQAWIPKLSLNFPTSHPSHLVPMSIFPGEQVQTAESRTNVGAHSQCDLESERMTSYWGQGLQNPLPSEEMKPTAQSAQISPFSDALPGGHCAQALEAEEYVLPVRQNSHCDEPAWL